jgi:hypothetical protein
VFHPAPPELWAVRATDPHLLGWALALRPLEVLHDEQAETDRLPQVVAHSGLELGHPRLVSEFPQSGSWCSLRGSSTSTHPSAISCRHALASATTQAPASSPPVRSATNTTSPAKLHSGRIPPVEESRCLALHGVRKCPMSPMVPSTKPFKTPHHKPDGAPVSLRARPWNGGATSQMTALQDTCGVPLRVLRRE